jgi:predicted ATPase/DNA-binding CsgD family transcriptional regulator
VAEENLGLEVVEFMDQLGRSNEFEHLVLLDPLTERELEIVNLLADGLPDQEIAQRLSLALETVKWYNKRIYSKLGVNNRTQAVARATGLGLLSSAQQSEPVAPVTGRRNSNLPAPLTSFVGRRHEIAAVKRLLTTLRLLTISGPAGSGKTRLALQVAAELMPHFPQGVCFVPLAPVTNGDKLLWAIAEHVELQFHSDDEPLTRLLSFFQGRNMLLVLDNFEHLLAGAELVTEILKAAPGVRVLVTSRERLNVYGESVYPLGELALPGRDDVANAVEAESVQLFMERARSVAPTLNFGSDNLCHTVRICRLVEGMPLAIELAATWVNVLSLEEIAEEIEQSLDILKAELRGIPARQTSMRAAIDRSWNMLNEAEQTAFRRMAVFRGGFTRSAVQAVVGVSLPTLQALGDKSLLQYDQQSGRYQLHELLRYYAMEQLEVSGEASLVYKAHANYFASFMAECWPQMKGYRQKQALLEVGADIENARNAWNFWIERQNPRELKQFFHSFWVIHDIRGWYPQGIALFAQAAEMLRTQSTDEAQAGLGWLLAVQGLYSVAGGAGSRKGYTLAQEGVQLLKYLNRRREMVIPLISLCITAIQVRENEIASQAAEDCLEIANETGDPWSIAKAKQLLALCAIIGKNYERASQLGHEALTIFEECGDDWSKSILCIEVLGLLFTTLRDFAQAKRWMERGLNAAQEIEFDYSIQTAYWQLGYVEALQNNYVEAGRWWHKAMEVGEQILGSDCFIGFGGSNRVGEWGGRTLINPGNGDE